MDGQKAKEARDAWVRIDRAIGDQERTNTIVTVEDEDGNAVPGERVPMAHVRAGDVVAVAEAIPADKRSRKAKDLRKGSRAVEPHRVVMCQCECLHELLTEADKYLPAAEPKPEPAPAE